MSGITLTIDSLPPKTSYEGRDLFISAIRKTGIHCDRWQERELYSTAHLLLDKNQQEITRINMLIEVISIKYKHDREILPIIELMFLYTGQIEIYNTILKMVKNGTVKN